MKTRLIALTIAGAFALGTLGVYAHEEGRGGGHKMQRFMHKGAALEHLTKDLDLTPQQQQQVQPIIDQAKPQLQAIHQEAMQKARAVIENASTQIRPLLTADQQQKFDALKKAHQEMMEARKAMHEAKMQ
ncbi:MAG: periplasmic heavy metal sensor [Verrucomicrobiaceae bacterium]|nr:periplasmic heavy metal sensor [Verrucomicrobiaceae bacterium]